MNILQSRHTIRNYDPIYEVPKEQLESIIKSACISPSYMGMQDVDFIVVNSRSKLQQITDAASATWDDQTREHIMSRAQKFKVKNVISCDAPTVIFIVKGKNPSPKVDVDAGIAAMSICVAATDLGLATMCMVLPICKPVAEIIGTEVDKMIVCVAIGKAKPDAHITKRTFNNNVRYIE